MGILNARNAARSSNDLADGYRSFSYLHGWNMDVDFMNKIRDWLIARFMQQAFKTIEKQNFVTKSLEICFKQEYLRDYWQKFLDSVESLLKDAIDEVKVCRTWGKK